MKIFVVHDNPFGSLFNVHSLASRIQAESTDQAEITNVAPSECIQSDPAEIKTQSQIFHWKKIPEFEYPRLEHLSIARASDSFNNDQIYAWIPFRNYSIRHRI